MKRVILSFIGIPRDLAQMFVILMHLLYEGLELTLESVYDWMVLPDPRKFLKKNLKRRIEDRNKLFDIYNKLPHSQYKERLGYYINQIDKENLLIHKMLNQNEKVL